LYIDADQIYNAVTGLLDSGVYEQTIWVEPTVQLASVTKAELMNSFGRISTFTTQTTSSANRNTNIRLAAEAISNTTLLPGETFSFNKATGQRTEAKGYKPAAAIAGGETFDEIGGGVCQTSSTLFNAVARANLTIIDRDPHAWPSNYVEKGEDATVNWPNLDFRFRNDTEWPIFIVAWYKDRKVTVEIYGMSLGDGVTIDLESKTTYVKEPPSEPLYVYNPELPLGKEEVTVKARTGYTVETYKVWYKNGQEIKREKLHTSHYKMFQKTIQYNDGYGGLR
jgi:vancomycin resistance protein YoaR